MLNFFCYEYALNSNKRLPEEKNKFETEEAYLQRVSRLPFNLHGAILFTMFTSTWV